MGRRRRADVGQHRHRAQRRPRLSARTSRATCAACRSWRPRITPVSPPERAKKNEGRNAVRIARARATRLPAVSMLAGMVLTAFAASAAAQVPEIRFARQFSMGYLQFNVMEKHQPAREARQGGRHSRGEGGVGDLQQPGGHERRAAVRLHRYRLGRGAGPADDLGAHARHRERGEGHGRVLVAADPAQHPQSQRQEHRGLHRQGQDRAPGGQDFGAGDDAADGGGQAVGTEPISPSSIRSRWACRRRTRPSRC